MKHAKKRIRRAARSLARSAKYNIGDNLMELKKLLDIALENARIAYGRRS